MKICVKTWQVVWVSLALLAPADAAFALDYVSVGESDAILYDAPSIKAKKLFVISRGTPLEQVIALDAWVKVRDSSGSLAWVERRALGDKRHVLVTAQSANIRQTADENSTILAKTQQQVLLDWLESTGTGWIKVRLPSAAVGYIKSEDVWGG